MIHLATWTRLGSAGLSLWGTVLAEMEEKGALTGLGRRTHRPQHITVSQQMSFLFWKHIMSSSSTGTRDKALVPLCATLYSEVF